MSISWEGECEDPVVQLPEAAGECVYQLPLCALQPALQICRTGLAHVCWTFFWHFSIAKFTCAICDDAQS